MDATPDAELLARHVRGDDPAAFAELVRRHAGLVYSAALRQTGRPHLAEDAAAMTFTTLARRAATLTRHPALPAWLVLTTRHTALKLVRSERRRLLRQARALADTETEPAAADWTRIAPVLDEALAALGETDRRLVVLRHFDGSSFAAVGARLGLSEAAAQMRCARALEKLRRALARRGVTSTATALSLALEAHAVSPAPAALIAACSALGATAGTGGALATLFSMSLAKHAATAAVAATLAGLAVHQVASRPAQIPAPAAAAPVQAVAAPLRADDDSALRRLAEENAALRARLAAAEAERDARAVEASSTKEKLAELRRPLEADIISSTLRATAVQPGEVIVTGGSLMPNGKRLYAFAKPVRQSNQGQEVVAITSHFLALDEEGASAAGLADLTSSAANTLQHGQIWSEGEFTSSFEKMRSAKGTDLLSAPRMILLPGKGGSAHYGEEGGEMLQLKVAPRLNPDGRSVDVDVRLELDPGPRSGS